MLVGEAVTEKNDFDPNTDSGPYPDYDPIDQPLSPKNSGTSHLSLLIRALCQRALLLPILQSGEMNDGNSIPRV
jgi:hypothetical protein